MSVTRFRSLGQAISIALIASTLVTSQISSSPATAATVGFGDCSQTYDLVSGAGALSVTSSGNFCYLAFKLTGAVGTDAVFTWTRPAGVTQADVLVLGGGGGGGSRHRGGGGAGRFVEATDYDISLVTTMTVTVGGGGAGADGNGPTYFGDKGNASSILVSGQGIIAPGGGAGAEGTLGASDGSGGSSGGSGLGTPSSPEAGTLNTFQGTVATGNNLGNLGARGSLESNSGTDATVDYWAGGGGGGAGFAGKRPTVNSVELTGTNNFPDQTPANTTAGGAGGDGASLSWLPASVADHLGVGETSSGSVYFAGGGGGGIGNDGASGGTGGVGGGGDGTKYTQLAGHATAHTGGGGGASGYDDLSPNPTQFSNGANNPPGGDGGSGVVIIRYVPKITITFESFGTAVSNVTANRGTSQAEPADPTTTSEAIFLGWTTTQGDASTLVSWPYTLTDSDIFYGLWKSSPGLKSVIDYSVGFNLSGYDDDIAVGSSASLGISSDGTWEMWLKPTAVDTSRFHHFLVKENTIALAIHAGRYQAFFGSGSSWGNGAWIDTGVSALVGQWQHTAFVKSGNNLKFYLNGQLSYEVTNSTWVPTNLGENSDRNLTIGHRTIYINNATEKEMFRGYIDEVKIWNDARSAGEISVAMHEKSQGSDSNLVAYWDFNESSGSVVYNREISSPSSTNLELKSGASSVDWEPARSDVKVTHTSDTARTIAFPRTYLPGVGGWTVPSGISQINALVVGGGGAGGFANQYSAGGGGGGEVTESANLSVADGAVYSVRVGQGGVSAATTNFNPTGLIVPTAGQTSSFDVPSSIYARPGGPGASGNGALSPFALPAANGYFTGGGGGAQAGAVKTANPGTGVGFSGGLAREDGNYASSQSGGGGGGANGHGLNGSVNSGGAGGPGRMSSVLPENRYFGGGGGGGKRFAGSGGGLGGSGGGGQGGLAGIGQDGEVNTGSGGGGAGGDVYRLGGSGGSGVVILSYEVAFVSISSPVNTEALSTKTASFTVNTAGSSGTLSFQWQLDSGSGFSNISGANSATYTTDALSMADNGNQYRVVVTSNVNGTTGTETSPAATLTVKNIVTERLILDYQASDINSFDPFEYPNSVSDLAGNYDGTWTEVSGGNRITLSDQAFKFDSSGNGSDYIEVEPFVNQDFSNGFTLDFLAKFDKNPGIPAARVFNAQTPDIIIVSADTTQGAGTPGNFWIEFHTGASVLKREFTGAIPEDGLFHRYTFVASTDGQSVRLYVNGVLHANNSIVSSFNGDEFPDTSFSASQVNIGNLPNGSRSLNGSIRHFRMFNEAFSSSMLGEIAVGYRSVAFESNGGTSYSPVSTSGALRLPSPAKVNSNFLGWFTSSNFSTPALGATYSPLASGSIYAKWVIPDFTLTLDNEGVTSTQTVALGSSPTNPNASKANHTLVGWSDDDDSTAEYLPDLSNYTMGSANDTLYAVWLTDYVNLAVGNCSMSVSRTVGVTITEMAGGACKVEFTSAGDYNWKVPANVSSLEALLVGGGGGGAAGRGGSWYGGGAGGGGGASTKVSLAVTTSQEIPLTVGAGGAAGTGAGGSTVTAASHGGNGTSSSFSGSDVVALGGLGGSASAALSRGGVGGLGGLGSGTVLSGGNGGKGSDGLATRTWERPTAGGSARSFTLGGENYCLGGGGGGGNRGVDRTPHFYFQAQGGGCSDTGLSSGGAGRYFNGSTYLGAVPGVANTGGGGGGGSYISGGGSSGAAGATGLVAIYFVPGAGSVALSQPVDRNYVANENVAITITKESPGAVSWTTSDPAICVIDSPTDSGANAQVKGTGLCAVSVTVAQSGGFNTGSAQVSFNVSKITRTAPSWDNASITAPFGSTVDLYEKLLNPSSSSAYSFTTSGTGCVVTGANLNLGDAGSQCSVTPTLVGDSIYLPAAGGTMTVSVTKVSQSSLVLTNATTMKVNETLTLSAAGGSGTGALSYAKDTNQADSATCTVDASTGAVTAAQAGSCWVYATRAQSTNYDAVASSHVMITFEKIPQVLQFVSQPQASYVSGNTYQVEATASSALTLAYSIGSGLGSVCSIASDTITFLGSGNCEIRAAQAGSGSYFAAQTISQIVSVGLINQSMTFSAIANKVWGSIAFNLAATVSSNLAVTYTEESQTTNDACDVTSNGVVSIKNVGRCSITATQAGNASYAQISRTQVFDVVADQAGAPFIGSVSFGDRQLTAAFFKPSYLGGGTISAYELRAYELDGTLASSNTGCTPGAGTTNSCTVIGLSDGTPYVLRVAAITQAGIGALSPSSSQITPASNPEAVGNLTAIEGNASLTLNWTQPTSFGGGNFFQYRIYWKAPGENYQALGAPGATLANVGSTSHVITGLQNGVSYDVKIITATNINNDELQSNTAEVNQTPYTVPDAPASVVALDNGSTVVIAWQPPTFDGGNPIDQYVVKKGTSTVCTITSVTTTSCEVAKPSPGTSTIEVRAGNDAGLSLPAETTFVVQSVAGSNQVVEGSGGISLPGVTPIQTRPIVTAVSGSSRVSQNDLIRFVGTNMRLVDEVLVGGVAASFFVNSDTLITVRIPALATAGKVVVTLKGAYGSVFFADLVEITTSQQQIDERVTIGTFLGYAAVYTKNHEGKRLSMKIGNKWRVIESLGANYTYNLTKVGAGKTVTVMVYIDRQLVQIKQIKVQ